MKPMLARLFVGAALAIAGAAMTGVAATRGPDWRIGSQGRPNVILGGAGAAAFGLLIVAVAVRDLLASRD